MENNPKNPSVKIPSKKECPHVFVILLGMILIVTILTYIIPAGSYQRS